MTFQDQEGETEAAAQEDATEDNNDSYEADSTTEGEGETESKETVKREPETPEAKRARLKRQLEQLDKKHGFKDEKGTQENDKDSSDDRYDRLALKTEGIADKDEQKIVIEYARWKKMDVLDAVKLPAVKAELQTLRSKDVPAPSTRTGVRTNSDDPAHLVKMYKAGKYLSPDQMRKVRKHIRG